MDFSKVIWMLLLKNTSSDFRDTDSQSHTCFLLVINRWMTMAKLRMHHLLMYNLTGWKSRRKPYPNDTAQSTYYYLENIQFSPHSINGSLGNFTQCTNASIPYPGNSVTWIWGHGETFEIQLLVPCTSPPESLQFILWQGAVMIKSTATETPTCGVMKICESVTSTILLPMQTMPVFNNTHTSHTFIQWGWTLMA